MEDKIRQFVKQYPICPKIKKEEEEEMRQIITQECRANSLQYSVY